MCYMITVRRYPCFVFFFFNDTATTEIYTLSLHDALPIWKHLEARLLEERTRVVGALARYNRTNRERSEEHTSELQSQSNLVCRLLLEKKKKMIAETVEYTGKVCLLTILNCLRIASACTDS